MASTHDNEEQGHTTDQKPKCELSKQDIPDRLRFVSEKLFEHHCGNEVYCRGLPPSSAQQKFFLTYAWPPFVMEKFEKVRIKDKQAWTKILVSTASQSESNEWFKERSNRITASERAHTIRNTNKHLARLAEKFVKETCNDRLNDYSSYAMRYGKQTESVAREQFVKKTGNRVDNVGLVVKMSQPFLAASPDGLILDDMSVLEIKCPSSRENASIINYKTGVSHVPYLLYHSKDDVQLNKKHKYYTQVQMQMYVCNAEKCHFFVYSSVDQVHLQIPRDDKFLSELIPKLERFYFTYMLPLLYDLLMNY